MHLSKRQRLLFNFIAQFIDKNGYSPSYREIMKELDYTSIATVALHVDNLVEKGYLRKKFNAARSLELVGVEDRLVRKKLNDLLRKTAEKADKEAVRRTKELLGF